jgi:hypothetical protein
MSIQAYAQHEHHNMPAKQPTPARKQTTKPKPTAKPKPTTPPKQANAQKAPAVQSKAAQADTMHLHHQPQAEDAVQEQDHSMHTDETMHMQDASHMRHAMDTHDSSMHNEHAGHNMHDMNMSHAFSISLPMNRNGSGTGWLPDASPMYGYMIHTQKWMYMIHGNLFLRYNNQDFTNRGSRGDAKVDVPNWVMAMGQRRVGKNGLFHFNTMLSLDAAIAGGSGYPLLFQSGETYKGKPLVDRQHPHDLFSELSVSYAHALSPKADVFAYLGYPGEPALGPVAFMHRPSSLFSPDAPISHHWIDATHITFGVATLGVRLGKFKLEGSSFTGREPNEKRFDFDKPRFDSRSGRLSFNPNRNWALQVSHAFLKSPEELHDEDVNRTTASAVYSLPLTKGWLNATATWGMNKVKNHDGEHAFLLEAAWNRDRLAIYGKYELVQKSVEELVLDETIYGHDAIFPVNAFTAGFNYNVLNLGKLRLAAGSQFTLYNADDRLDALYGGKPMAIQVFLRLYPWLMNM